MDPETKAILERIAAALEALVKALTPPTFG